MDEATVADAEVGAGAIPDTMSLSGVYSAREAAVTLGVNERTIRRAIARSELAASKHGRAFQITTAALASYRESRSARGQRRPDSGISATTPPARIPSRWRLVDAVCGPAFAIPRPLTSFLGREREVDAVSNLLTQPDVRLLTLTGPGGIGKTRLALRVMECIESRYDGGVAFVPLASVTNADLISSTVAQAVGVREHAGRPIAERLISALRERRLLLVLDNFEHVLPAAPFVAELLRACPGLTIIVTSRATLRISGEQCFTVPPLVLPEVTESGTEKAIADAEAVRLFAARARAAQPEFAVDDENATAVAAVCRRLDGLPLAIELAAARIAVLPPQALLTRLERRLPLLTGGPLDAPQRLQTMRGAIAWSYGLLDEQEQSLFRRLSVFAGGWTLEAAAAVAGAGIDVVQGISALMASSLVRQEGGFSGDPRYQMLETLREYGHERLAESGEDREIRQRHAMHFLALVERWSPDPVLPGEQRRMAAISPDYDNVRLALIWLDEHDDTDALLRLSGSLFEFWLSRGLLAEGRYWMRQALAHNDRASPRVLLRALTTAGALASHQGDRGEATPLIDAALPLAQRVGNAGQRITAFINSGLHAYFQEQYAVAEQHLHAGLASANDLSDDDPAKRHVTGVICNNLGLVAFAQGQLERAAGWFTEAICLLRAAEYGWALDHALTARGGVAYLRGDVALASTLFVEALELAWAIPDPRKLAIALLGIAGVSAARGSVDTAAQLLGAAEAITESVGVPFAPSDRPVYNRVVSALTAALDEPRFSTLREAGRLLGMAKAVTAAREIVNINHAELGTLRERVQSSLTPRELAVLRLIALARTDQEIADVLFISRRTVNGHVARILSKLDVPSRRAAVARSRQLGLLPS